ncbi:MAG: hypothetical protein GTO02_14410 [Candidatus Dadabacteria bacterium]|nr:hypothetical protein [Candidatus Dadabacteria bacterium]
MKSILIIFIIAGIIFISGISTLFYSTFTLLEEYPDLQVIYDGELEGGQQVVTPISLAEGDQITISILTSNNNLVFFYIENEEQNKIVESVFSEKLSFPLSANQSGVHIIGIGNMGDTSLRLSNYITEEPIFDTELVKNLSDNTVMSYSLIFIGIVLFLINLVLFFVVKIIKNQKSKRL